MRSSLARAFVSCIAALLLVAGCKAIWFLVLASKVLLSGPVLLPERCPISANNSAPRHFMPNRKTKKREHKRTRINLTCCSSTLRKGQISAALLFLLSIWALGARLRRWSVGSTMAPTHVYTNREPKHSAKLRGAYEGRNLRSSTYVKNPKRNFVTNSKMCNANLAFFSPPRADDIDYDDTYDESISTSYYCCTYNTTHNFVLVRTYNRYAYVRERTRNSSTSDI